MSIFPVFLKLAGRRVLVVGGGPVAAGKLRALLDAEADVTVVAPRRRRRDCRGAGSSRAPGISGERRRGRLVRGCRGAAGGQSRSRGGSARERRVRECRGRHRERECLCRRRAPARGRDHRAVVRRRGAGARRPDARGSRGSCCPRIWNPGWRPRARNGSSGWQERVPMDAAAAAAAGGAGEDCTKSAVAVRRRAPMPRVSGPSVTQGGKLNHEPEATAGRSFLARSLLWAAAPAIRIC